MLNGLKLCLFFRRSCSSIGRKKEIMKYLNVAEKNDAAKNIANIISRNSSRRREGFSVYNKIYEFDTQLFGGQVKMIMTSVSGHLLNYEFAAHFKNWNGCNPLALFDAPIEKFCPQDYQPIKRTLEREIRTCAGLIIWTDCDREGENIGYEIIKVCKDIKPNIQLYRAKFSEITFQSINRALNNLGRPDQNVSDAVDVRQELDLRTGAAFTRLQTLRLQKVFSGTLADKLISYGSCQFPTLGFVVERYQTIENFIAEPFWKIKMSHTVEKLTTEFLWKRDRLFEKGAVQSILDICQENSLARVKNVQSKPKSKWRPLPLDTIEMEKNISRKLRINAKEVMKVAERLYTQGLISYPRTETNIFPNGLNLEPLVQQQRENERWGNFANRILNEGGPNPRQGRKSDQAHPPIHPIKYANNLQGNDARIYEYIVRHFLACVQKDAQGHETIITVDIAGEKFTAKGLIVLERNYLDVYIYEQWNTKEINNYRNGDTFEPTVLNMTEGSTTAPKLLTEADLISLMEKHGIGTDATHAEHIETIKSREYVGMQDIYFVPATLGMGLVEGHNNMGLEISLAKPNLRADFENDLKLICEGRKDADVVKREQIIKYKEAFKMVAEKMRVIDASLANRLDVRPQDFVEPVGGTGDYRPALKCPKCGSDMVLKDRRNGAGKYMTCTRYPNCKNSIWFEGVSNVEVTDSSCHVCGPETKMLKIHFRQNPFLGEPNPNVLCIGGCDMAVLAGMDIPISSVKKQNTTRAQLQTTNENGANANASTTTTVNRNTNILTSWINTSRTTNNTETNNRTATETRATAQGNPRNNSAQRNISNNSNISLLPGPSRANTQLNRRNNIPSQSRNNSNETNSNNSINQVPGPSRGNNTLNTSITDGNSNEINCNCDKPALLLTVRKEGPNKGREFYKCGESSCNFFLWASGGEPSTSTNITDTNTGNNYICGCNMPAVRKTTFKEGPNKGRHFYCCNKPQGQGCNYFKWEDEEDNGGGGVNWDGDDGGGGGGRGRGRGRGRGGKGERGKTISKRNGSAPYSTQTKAKRKCGLCGQEGHTRNKCPNS